MAQNPDHLASYTLQDYSKETSTVEVHVAAITAATLPAFLTEFGDWKLAVDGVTLGTAYTDSWTGDRTKYNNAPPSDVNAQRERKFLVIYQSPTTFTKYQIEIPTADLTGRLIAGTDLVDMTNAQVVTLVNSFEAFAVTPEGENNPEVLEIRAVGRAN